MDEPTASLSANEVRRLFRITESMRQEASRSSSSRTAWTRSSRSPTGSRSCATAAGSGRRGAASSPRTSRSGTWSAATSTTSSSARRHAPGEVVLEARGLGREGVFATSRSRFAPARCWASRVSSGARRTDVGLALFGDRAGDQRADPARWSPGDGQEPGRGAPARDRLLDRGSAGARPGPAAVDRREHLAAVAPALPIAGSGSCAGRRGGHGAEYKERLRIRARLHRRARLVAVGRQPAEGRAEQVAQHEPARADPRRADAGHRRRRQGRGPPDHRRPGEGRDGHHPHQLGAARGPPHERPHPGDARGPADGHPRPRRRHRGERPRCRDGAGRHGGRGRPSVPRERRSSPRSGPSSSASCRWS